MIRGESIFPHKEYTGEMMNTEKKAINPETILFILMSICSGLMIGIGGTASLVAVYLFDIWGKLVGSILFSLGIYAILTYEMRLFTGMVASIPKMGWKNAWQLPVCFLGNALGVAFAALVVSWTPLSAAVIAQSKLLVAGKLATENLALSAIGSGILCGVLITLSVWSVKHCPKKGLSASFGVTFPIVVFAFCGFDHSVANILYFLLSGTYSWQAFGYELCCIVGNVLGGIILPYISLFRERIKKD